MVYDYKLHLVIRTPRACPWEQSVKKRYYFVHKRYRCSRCNAEWYSEDYPLGLNADILDKLNRNGKHQSNEDALRDLEDLIKEDIAPTLPMKKQY